MRGFGTKLLEERELLIGRPTPGTLKLAKELLAYREEEIERLRDEIAYVEEVLRAPQC